MGLDNTFIKDAVENINRINGNETLLELLLEFEKILDETGIYAYTRNPIYLAFVGFNLSMFLVFENVMYFISSIGLSLWLHHWVIKVEEEYLLDKFSDEFTHYKSSVKRWLFFYFFLIFFIF